MLFGFMLLVLSPYVWIASPRNITPFLIFAGMGFLFLVLGLALEHGWI